MISLALIRKVIHSFSSYHPIVEVLISKANLLYNLRAYQRAYSQLSLAPVLKSNAYGHGLIPVAQIFDKEDVVFLVVDSLYEAIVLRNAGVRSEIVVIGYTRTEHIISCKLRGVVFTLTSLAQLQEIAGSLRRRVRFHLKIDTGMHRQGVLASEVDEVIELIKAHPSIHLEGLCSHLADADGADAAFTRKQINVWNNVVAIIQEQFKGIRYLHIAATAGMQYAQEMHANVARIGIGLYGIAPSAAQSPDLRLVLQMQSVISSIKTVQAGEYVGYNNTYKADRARRIATVPVGYFEGVDRRLSNCGFFKIGEHMCPIVGRVSMNITTIDVSDVPQLRAGDAVTIISSEREDMNSVEHMARSAKTIPYDILVHIPQHLRRTII